MNSKVLLLGAGYMGKEYSKVLDKLSIDYDVITRSAKTAEEFYKARGKKALSCELSNYLSQNHKYTHVINAYRSEALAESNMLLLKAGFVNILTEKPGAMTIPDMKKLCYQTLSLNSKVYIAYNRRFYQSVFAAEKIIQNDGGLKSIDFEFTEWPHLFGVSKLTKEFIDGVMVGNSGHVIDLAWFFAGRPKKYYFISDYLSKDSKPCGIFCGSGITEKDVYFTYRANWSAPGRWGIELLTNNHKIYLRPLEKLQIQNIKSIQIEPYEIDDNLDIEFKPGVYLETKSFLEGNNIERLKTVNEQLIDIKIINAMKEGVIIDNE